MTYPGSRHAARPRLSGRFWAVLGLALLVIGGAAAAIAIAANRGPAPLSAPAPPLPASATVVPAPTIAAMPPTTAICELPEVQAALAEGDDAAVIAAGGGAASFRAAVAAGDAPCVSLGDPARVWHVVNKARPYEPAEFEPAGLTAIAGIRSVEGAELRADAAAALTELVGAAATAGAGEIGLDSAYRSYETQIETHQAQVEAIGEEAADLISARAGYSEHQSGLAADVVACDGECGSYGDFGGTAQGAWVAENAWRFGFVVRYDEGQTPITGYQPEPWHLRYIGPELAEAYREGGYGTLEEFFGLPAAPGFAG